MAMLDLDVQYTFIDVWVNEQGKEFALLELKAGAHASELFIVSPEDE